MCRLVVKLYDAVGFGGVFFLAARFCRWGFAVLREHDDWGGGRDGIR